MAMLCFLLDLRTLPPPVLRDLKQSLLQLANFYAILPVGRGRGRGSSDDVVCPLSDRIGLCYLHWNGNLHSDELKIAHSPKGKFNLRDFHLSVNSLPMECFLHTNDSHSTDKLYLDIGFAELMSNENFCSWGGKDILKKVIYIGSSLVRSSEGLRKTIMNVVEHRISVEFIVLRQDQYHGCSENVEQFARSIADLENCLLRTYAPNSLVFCGLVKLWHQDLNNDIRDSLVASFHFKETVVGTKSQIMCNLSASYNHILDYFEYCQVCRCHGHPVGNAAGKEGNSIYCSVLNCELRASEMIENAVKVGEQTILFMPSFQSFPDVRVPQHIDFHVLERTKLATLDEGVIVGDSYIVTPATSYELEASSDDFVMAELNVQFVQGLSQALSLLDQALVCVSNFDILKMECSEFHSFYVLQPSDRRTMLLRRLAASEEIWPIPQTTWKGMNLSKEVEESIQAVLSKMELKDYNPALNDSGFHQKLNLLVKESLQFGLISLEKTTPELRPIVESDVSSSEKSSTDEISQVEIQPFDKSEQQIPLTQDWEGLILVSEVKENRTPSCIENPRFGDLSSTQGNKPMDAQTTRILERLEAPKLKASKQAIGTKPNFSSNTFDESARMPLETDLLSPKLSELIKPSFQRLKKKHR